LTPSFADRVRDVAEIQFPTFIPAGPIFRIDALPDPAVETRPQPVARALDVAVFDRIVMCVIEMPFEIVVVFQRVFPEFRLPDAAATVAPATGRLRLFLASGTQPAFCEFLFDPASAFGIRIVTGR